VVGGYPGSLLAGSDGTLYGTATGGAYDQGMVFALSPPQSPGAPWTEQAIYNFSGTIDGAYPGSLIAGPNGILYGSAGGGTFSNGLVFELTPPVKPRLAWLETVLWNVPPSFSGAQVTLYSDGVFCGSIASPTGYGLFQLQREAGGTWTPTVLYSFPANGKVFSSQLILRHGGIYGTTARITGFGGQGRGGDVFELQRPATAGEPWKERILHHFEKRDSPHGNIVFDADGVIYGTTDTSNAPPHQGFAYQLTVHP
jgi:hypothetical protein